MKRCGYATSPTYAKALIELIERHGLDQYDDEGIQWIKRGGMLQPQQDVADETGTGQPGEPTGRSASAGRGPAASPPTTWRGFKGLAESLADLAAAYQLSVWQLRKYNDLKGADGSTVLAFEPQAIHPAQTASGSRDWHCRRGRDPSTISDAEAVKLKVLVDRPTKGQTKPCRSATRCPSGSPHARMDPFPGTPVWAAEAEPVPR